MVWTMHRLWLLFLAVAVALISRSQALLTWRKITTTGTAPSGRRDLAIGYDEVNKYLYIFGGRGTSGVTNDLYRLRMGETPARWEQLHGTKPDSDENFPQRRFSLVSGFYTNRDLFVIATGEHETRRFYNDVWTYDPSAAKWTKQPNNGKVPETRYGGAGGLHRNGSQIWVSHGFDNKRYSNTFRYDLEGKRWIEEFSGTTPYDRFNPHARCLLGSAMLSATELVFYGGCLRYALHVTIKAPCKIIIIITWRKSWTHASTNKTSSAHPSLRKGTRQPYMLAQSKGLAMRLL